MFNWDEFNIAHIARHGVEPREAEEVITNDPIDLSEGFRNGEERSEQIGETNNGRILRVLTTLRNGKIRVMSQITELLAHAPSTFSVLAGDDALALPVIALGGTGLISVASNAIPGPMSRMIAAALANNWPTARQINSRHFALMQAHFIEPSPAPIKATLALLGRCSETLRLPMVPVTEATRTKLKSLLHDLDLLPAR